MLSFESVLARHSVRIAQPHMNSNYVLRWDMHGADTFVSFGARRVDSGYLMVVTRDDNTWLLSDIASDAETLFRKSEMLRRGFEEMGYLTKPGARCLSRLAGGVCWGPGAPVRPPVIAGA